MTAEHQTDDGEYFVHFSAPPCEHDFQGWREFENGLGGEQFCSKCGMGGMEHTLRNDPT
jgi:hypothetical protein